MILSDCLTIPQRSSEQNFVIYNTLIVLPLMKPVGFSMSDHLMFYGFTAIMIQSESDYQIIS